LVLRLIVPQATA